MTSLPLPHLLEWKPRSGGVCKKPVEGSELKFTTFDFYPPVVEPPGRNERHTEPGYDQSLSSHLVQHGTGTELQLGKPPRVSVGPGD